MTASTCRRRNQACGQICGPLSARLRFTYNAASIFAYQYQNLNSDGTPMNPADLTAGGTAGPGGDNYLYAHMQVDAQASMRIHSGVSVIVYGLNLTNEVFGFYITGARSTSFSGVL